MKPNKPRTIWQQIRGKVRDGRAPPCPSCGTGGSLTGGQLGTITCTTCYARFRNLVDAWKSALMVAEARLPNDDPPPSAG